MAVRSGVGGDGVVSMGSSLPGGRGCRAGAWWWRWAEFERLRGQVAAGDCVRVVVVFAKRGGNVGRPGRLGQGGACSGGFGGQAEWERISASSSPDRDRSAPMVSASATEVFGFIP